DPLPVPAGVRRPERHAAAADRCGVPADARLQADRPRGALRGGDPVSSLPPDSILRALQSPRWTGMLRVGLDAAQIERWDPTLLRQPRLLVPVDVQALSVEKGSTERFVRLPFALTQPDDEAPETMPEPFAPGETRPAGVHLHWAPPDALLRGAVEEAPAGAANRL